jgi:hypothetical protein
MAITSAGGLVAHWVMSYLNGSSGTFSFSMPDVLAGLAGLLCGLVALVFFVEALLRHDSVRASVLTILALAACRT